jgi:hypothetical protein
MIRVVAGLIAAVSLCGAVDKDMQRAIAWERHKEQAAARQAAIEKRHPTVTYNNTANRSSEEQPEARPVKDSGAKK